MGSVSINYKGELFKGDEVTPAIARAANIAKTYGLALVKARTPVDTGDLKGGWKARLEGNGIRWTNETRYAGFVEFGTVKMAPRSMLSGSLADIKQVFDEELSNEVGKALGADIVTNHVTPSYSTAGVGSEPKKYTNVGNKLQPKVKTGLSKKNAKTSKSYLFADPAKILNAKQEKSIASAKPKLQRKK